MRTVVCKSVGSRILNFRLRFHSSLFLGSLSWSGFMLLVDFGRNNWWKHTQTTWYSMWLFNPLEYMQKLGVCVKMSALYNSFRIFSEIPVISCDLNSWCHHCYSMCFRMFRVICHSVRCEFTMSCHWFQNVKCLSSIHPSLHPLSSAYLKSGRGGS